MTPLWELHPHQIFRALESMSFTDYARLMISNPQAEHILSRYYYFCWDANYGKSTKFYEWPVSETQLKLISWRMLFDQIVDLRHRMLNLRRENCVGLDPVQINEKICRFIQDYGSDRSYFVPLLYLSQHSDEELFTNPLNVGITLSLSIMTSLQKLLQYQNTSVAFDFFRDSRPNEINDIEKCLFEVSRFRSYFAEVAKVRAECFEKIREKVRKARSERILEPQFGVNMGTLFFPSTGLFIQFLDNLVKAIFTILPAPRISGYLGPIPVEQFGRTRVNRISVIAKILNEEIFGDFEIKINGLRMTLWTYMTSDALIIGSYQCELCGDNELRWTSRKTEAGDLLDYYHALVLCKLVSGSQSESVRTFNANVDRAMEYLTQ